MTSPYARHLPARLDFAVGAPVTLTFNMQQQLGLCNGSRGVVYDIIDDPSSPQPIVLARMDDYVGPSFLENISGVVPIVCQSASLVSGKKTTYRIVRTALPLRLAYATTIHKSQGQTCTTVVLNPLRMQDCALAYVALSRARNRSDVFITAPMDVSQLEKKPAEREIDDVEAERVPVIENETICKSARLVSDMVSEADAHNQRLMRGTEFEDAAFY